MLATMGRRPWFLLPLFPVVLGIAAPDLARAEGLSLAKAGYQARQQGQWDEAVRLYGAAFDAGDLDRKGQLLVKRVARQCAGDPRALRRGDPGLRFSSVPFPGAGPFFAPWPKGWVGLTLAPMPTPAGGRIMRIADIIFVLLALAVFGLAIEAFMGLHFSLDSGTFYWAAKPA
jgi:hypothetical protein